MRALREATHTTNIDNPKSTNPMAHGSLVEISQSTESLSNSSFQPIFNWDRSQPSFLGRFNEPTTPVYANLIDPADKSTPTLQGINSRSMLSDDSPAHPTPLELAKPVPRPTSRSAAQAFRGKPALRSARDPVQVLTYRDMAEHRKHKCRMSGLTIRGVVRGYSRTRAMRNHPRPPRKTYPTTSDQVDPSAAQP
jgi:hypothetical protein